MKERIRNKIMKELLHNKRGCSYDPCDNSFVSDILSSSCYSPEERHDMRENEEIQGKNSPGGTDGAAAAGCETAETGNAAGIMAGGEGADDGIDTGDGGNGGGCAAGGGWIMTGGGGYSPGPGIDGCSSDCFPNGWPAMIWPSTKVQT